MYKYRTVFAILPIRVWKLIDNVAYKDGWFWLRYAKQHYTLWNGWVTWRDENE